MKHLNKIKKELARLITDETTMTEIMELISNETDAYLESEINSLDKNSIPRTRFNEVNKQKNEAIQKMQELEDNVKQLNEKLSSTDIKEIEALRTKVKTFETNIFTDKMNKWNKVQEYFNVPENHKDFDRRSKLKSKFVTLNDEKKEYTIDDLEKNLEVYSILEDAGAITDYKEDKVPYNNPAPKTDNKPEKSFREKIIDSINK